MDENEKQAQRAVMTDFKEQLAKGLDDMVDLYQATLDKAAALSDDITAASVLCRAAARLWIIGGGTAESFESMAFAMGNVEANRMSTLAESIRLKLAKRMPDIASAAKMPLTKLMPPVTDEPMTAPPHTCEWNADGFCIACGALSPHAPTVEP